MSESTSAAVPLPENDYESRSASTTEREINSSDMEIDDKEGEDDFQGSLNRNDASNIMESEQNDGCQGSDLIRTSGKFETRIPSKTLDVEEGSVSFKFSSLPNESLAQKEDLRTNDGGSKYSISGKEKAILEYTDSGKDSRAILERKAPEDYCEQHTNSKSNLVVNEIMYETTNLSSVAGKEIAVNEIISIPVGYHSGGVNSVLGFEGKSKQMDLQTKDDQRRIKSRSAALQTSAGSPSPGVEFNSVNKRPAIICDFFARGWCIKGNSCRFLHIKESEKNPTQQPEEDVDAADGKRAVEHDEGLRNAAERSRSPASTYMLPSSVLNKTGLSSHFFAERILPLGNDENQRLHLVHEINKFPLLRNKDKSMGTSPASQWFSASADDMGPSKDVRQNGIGLNLPADKYAKPASLSDKGRSTFRNCFLPEYRSSLSGSVTSLADVYSENQSHHVSTCLASLPFSYPSSACSLSAQKLSDIDRERHASRLSSLLQGSSPFSSSEPENFPVKDIARNQLHFTEYRIKFSPDDWEASVPFRPSFFVTSGISSPRSQYDPLCDGIDLSNAGERSLKFSFSNPGPSLLNVPYPPTYGDSTSMGLLFPECNSEKRTASCHNRYHENLVNKNCHTSGKDSLTTDANDGNSAADMQNGTLVREEISSVASHVKDISKTINVDTHHDGSHRTDESRCNKDLKAERIREKNEIDVELEHKADGDVLKESKAMRHFHAALVDLVKELLKPAWREGHLSKDAHNTIVKKAIDKVLDTVQPHQIPSTFESVKQYLSSSQPKIARLVEGYIDKYKKS